LALKLITKLVKDHGDVSVPALSSSLHESFSSWSNLVPTKSNAKVALAAMHWISAIFVQSPA
jgi:hypothetical protein